MLSHLVGAANRADIRRLRELEAEMRRCRRRLPASSSTTAAACSKCRSPGRTAAVPHRLGSHNAVAIVKRVVRSAGKPYMAQRSSGLASFAGALRAIAARACSAVAEGA
jgi:hypothetical protein